MRAVHTGLYVIMGVSGSGKSLVGAMLGRALDIAFVDGDDLHPQENVKRMAAAIPLTDEDRHGWLLAIAARLRTAQRAGIGLVVACSALKRRYRDLLRASGDAGVRFVFLQGNEALLESQLAILEEPSPDEHAWVCDIRAAPHAIVADLVSRAA